MATILPIESGMDLQRALGRVEELWPKKDQNKKSADELKVLAVLIESYERTISPILPPTPIEAIRFRMDQLGLKTIDLAEYMGTTRARASEILNGKRPLTLAMIRRLTLGLKLNAEVLIGVRAPVKATRATTRRQGKPKATEN